MLRLLFALAASLIVLSPAAQSLEAARKAFETYQFDKAEEILEAYTSKRKKEQIAADKIEDPYRPGITFDAAEELRDRIVMARNMFERVENVTVIDTIVVDRNEFFDRFRLDPSTGLLGDADLLSDYPVYQAEALLPVFASDHRQSLIWAQQLPDAPGSVIMEAWKLADGSSEEPQKLFDRGEIFGDDIPGMLYSPFLMADGVTLYFAADGPQSIGGLDIFMTREGGENKYLQPSNVGMPYNSPANDFMMAIDEVTGAGWWASDRDTDEDHVKIYIFKPSDLRVNLSPDREDLADYALLRKFNSPATEVRGEVLSVLNALGHHRRVPTAEFQFAMPDGKVYTHLTDFRTPEAREIMEDWLAYNDKAEQIKEQLVALRREFTPGSDSATRIKALEQEETELLKKCSRLTNDIIRCESR